MEQGYTRSATDYYPFGKSFENVNVAKNRYLYNGKELQDQLVGGTPFGWYDYGARFYDPELGRWHTPDPLEQYECGYVYAGNNPILLNDPTGMWAATGTSYGQFLTVVDPIGNIIYHDNRDNKIYYSSDGVVGADGNVTNLPVVGTEKPGEDYHKGATSDLTMTIQTIRYTLPVLSICIRVKELKKIIHLKNFLFLDLRFINILNIPTLFIK